MIRKVRCIPFVFLAFVSATAFAQKQEIRFTLMGADAGSNTYERQADGSFTSVTNLNLAGRKIESRLTGRFVEGLLVEYALVQSGGGVTVTITVKDGRVVADVAGKKQEAPYKPSAIVFANYHPALSSAIIAAYPPTATDPRSFDVLLLDNGIALKVDVSRRAARSVVVNGQPQSAQVYQVRFATVDIEVFTTEDRQVIGWNVPTQFFKGITPGWEELILDPTLKMKELSQPDNLPKAESNLRISMRDGVELSADLTRPVGDGRYPTILVRTPYGKAGYKTGAEWWARRGYVWIVEDVRGRGQSDGDWTPLVHERADGYDTIDWISKQPWSNGSVGMIGGSYVAWVQWYAAVERHPALKCIVPQVSPPDPFYNFPIDHGIPFLYGGVWWAAVVQDKGPITSLPKLTNLDSLKALPISEVDDKLLGKDVPFIDQWWTRTRPSEFGPANFMADLKGVTIPALQISGWWDGDGIGTKLNWEAMRRLGRTNQWLIYGPWTHAFNTTSRLGDVDYGPQAILELDSLYLRWFDTWLKGKDVGLQNVPKVRVFVTGANRWVDLADWPAPRSRERTLYLSSAGPANGPDSVGELAESRPSGPQEPDRYAYNPARAAIPDELKSQDPTTANTRVKLEPKDQDTLIYKSQPLEAPLVMMAPVDVELYIASTARDTDLYATVVDIDEQGGIRVIGQGGKIRARYHRGFEKPEFLKPGTVYRLRIAHWDVAHEFAKGHRIGLMITSDGFPLFARNLGYGEPEASAVRMTVQLNTIYHDARRPSALRFRSP